MINKTVDQITIEDIEALVTDAVTELRTLEYKRELPGKGDDDKKEFLADVCAFANSAGGDIVFGVAENRETGEPEQITGLHNVNLDTEKQRLESMIKDGIEPRVPQVHFATVKDSDSKTVLVLRIGQSWMAPHMVAYKGLSRFFSRNNTGKYQLDVDQIKSAFLFSEKRAESIRRFRQDGIARVINNDAPVTLHNGAGILLQLCPLMPASLDIVRDDEWVCRYLTPIYGSLHDWRYNIDGILANSSPSGSRISYVQVFRDGAFEAVSTVEHSTEERRKLPALSFERVMLQRLELYIAAMRDMLIDYPIVLMISLIGFKGYQIQPENRHLYDDVSVAIDRDLLLLPDILIMGKDDPFDVQIRPVFDALWQAAGWDRCKYYNAEGRHVSEV